VRTPWSNAGRVLLKTWRARYRDSLIGLAVIIASSGAWWWGSGRGAAFDKAITVAGNRLDATALGSALIKDVAQLRDLDIEVSFLDRSARPHFTEYLILGDCLTAVSRQQRQ
jgi:hypothetical protein